MKTVTAFIKNSSGNIMNSLVVEGVDGYFKSTISGTFHKILHFSPNPNYDENVSYDVSNERRHCEFKLINVGSVSAGNYGGEGFKPRGNKLVHEQIAAKINKYLDSNANEQL